MPTDHTEKGFEQAIESHLLSHGYEKGNPEHFVARLALDPVTLVRFLKDTQPKEWAKLAGLYGSDAEAQIVETIALNLDQRGSLDCLRHGVTDRGVKLRLAFFQPATRMNPETLALYQKNVLTITRQARYSEKKLSLSVDVVLALNGIPVATAELKNPFTGQTAEHAKRQYKNDRDPSEPLFQFKRRALVHFAVDPDEVFMTTRLAGKGTFFLPFNKGRQGGRGNPDNPVSGWKTSYLWEEVWARDSWLDILARFVHLMVEEKVKDSKKVRTESLVFPRYHQLDAVRKLLAAARAEGPGHNYLIQHSAGSGKSNSIAWLAHRLASLHDADDKLIFDSIIVVTDRRVLDKQLQDTIYQFEHAQGVVQKIDENSEQLGKALGAGTRIVITTLQKFSFVLDRIKELPKRNYALIVDEAHSSQTGESATSLRRVLAAGSLEEAEKQEGTEPKEDSEEEILKAINARGPQKNLSFFAFTATPKHKTLEMFGRNGIEGKPEPFHLYSMRQAIEEGFILDVLQNYTTYKTYYRLTKAVEDDPELDRKKATQAIARFVSLHPHNLAQKTEVMVEHFRHFTGKKIGGKAKAMVVTRSRLHAVHFKQAFDRYLKDKGYADLRALVAFSGTVKDGEADYTEAGMNGFGERQLPEKFDTDDYQFLIVAEKYQTGFDQPLLHTMYVDKKLDGLQAVQTLSRLNRTCPGKEDTFVLDFVNEAEEVKESFKPYYEQTQIEERVDPNLLYTLRHKLDGFQIYWLQEVEDFAKVFFKPPDKQREADKGLLHKCVDPAVGRFQTEPEERQVEFRHQLGTFLRLYAFLSQVVNFADPDLEKRYAFGRLLITKLKIDDGDGPLFIDDDVRLAYYRLTKTHEGSAALLPGEGVPVSGPTDVGTGRPVEEDRARLSEVVDVLNDRFGTDFTKEDQLFFDQVMGDMRQDEQLADQARNNTPEQFKLAFDPKAMAALIARLERNEDISGQLMSNEELRAAALELMMQKVYEHFQAEPSKG
ncbi:MAG TPA: DEAD/DEAH box helicase family protein [Gemmatales bacterium]|nr:DEAD/DEAH box helicase family protein [Gemmatales bacterium]